MALRAGYYGLKNSVKKTLEKLASDMSGAKIIKSVGAGLNLSDQGALTADIKTVGDYLTLSEAGKLSGNGLIISDSEQKIGKLGNDDLYQKSYIVKSTDFEDATITADVIKGAFLLDIPDFNRLWLDESNSYFFNGAETPAPKALALNYYSGTSDTKYTRTNIQQRPNMYDGKPFVYIDTTYANTIYSNISDVEWLFTVKYTKATV